MIGRFLSILILFFYFISRLMLVVNTITGNRYDESQKVMFSQFWNLRIPILLKIIFNNRLIL